MKNRLRSYRRPQGSKQKEPERIGIFGGSFDPVHTGHLLIAQAASEQLRLDRLFFVPAGRSPHKPTRIYASAGDRIAMVKSGIREMSGWACDGMEVRRTGVSYSIDTISAFREKYASSRLFLLIGSDNLRSFHTWKDAREIKKLVKIVVYRRFGWSVPETLLRRWDAVLLKGPEIFLSSTDIRARIAKGGTCRYLIPMSVERYIKTHSLYRFPQSER